MDSASSIFHKNEENALTHDVTAIEFRIPELLGCAEGTTKRCKCSERQLEKGICDLGKKLLDSVLDSQRRPAVRLDWASIGY